MLNEPATPLPPSLAIPFSVRALAGVGGRGEAGYGEIERMGQGGNKGHILPSPAYFAPLHSGPAQSRGLCFRDKAEIWLIALLFQSEHHSMERGVEGQRGEERRGAEEECRHTGHDDD